VKVLVCTVKQFNGHELWAALATLQKHGIEFEVVSQEYIIRDEVDGKRHKVVRLWNEVHDTFDGIMVVSGDPRWTEKMWKDRYLERIVRKHEGKPVAAICASVPAIRYVTAGKKVSTYPLIRAKQLLQDAGAILTNMSLCVDTPVVTAENQLRSKGWAEAFCALVEGKDPDTGVYESNFAFKLKERKPIPEVERLKRSMHE
jgi:putative intracellular protease/amidase